MVAGRGWTHASRKPEGPRELSERTVTKKIPTSISLLDENYTGAWTACATKRIPKAAQTRLMVSKRG